MLPLRAKSVAPAELEVWGEERNESCLTTRIADLVVGRNKEYCERKRSQINASVPCSTSSNGIAGLVGATTNGTRAMLPDSKLPPCFMAESMTAFMYLHNRTATRVNEGIKPYERFYGMKPDKVEDDGI